MIDKIEKVNEVDKYKVGDSVFIYDKDIFKFYTAKITEIEYNCSYDSFAIITNINTEMHNDNEFVYLKNTKKKDVLSNQYNLMSKDKELIKELIIKSLGL